jgi:hypothetical protein
VSLLAESFNPHVRYGAALAVGVACAGSGGREAVALLESMIGDSVDFVRQGVYTSLALVQLQQPEARVEGLRKRLAKAVGDKHEETMARMGAAIATGASALRPSSGLCKRAARACGPWGLCSAQRCVLPKSLCCSSALAKPTPLPVAASLLQASWTLAAAT